MHKITLILLIILNFSCSDSDVEPLSNKFQVTITGTGIDCKLPIIDFLEQDSARIKNVNGSTHLRYEALCLDPTLNQVDLTLNVVVRKTQDDEFLPCTTLGIPYPLITILNAEKID